MDKGILLDTMSKSLLTMKFSWKRSTE